MSRYHRATTVFSSEGKLLQVQYAQEAVKQSSAVVGVKGQGAIVLAAEKKILETLQDEKTERKIMPLDDHVALVYSGLRADARVLISRSQIECQSHRLIVEDPATTEYIVKYISQLKQSYTQAAGRRPFGLSCLVAGFDPDGTPHLYQTEPSGEYTEWKATAVGRCAKSIQVYLEQNYKDHRLFNERGILLLAVSALLEASHRGQKNFDIAVIKPEQKLYLLDQVKVQELINEAHSLK